MTKIIGTLGPKSRSVEVIEACLTAGMSGRTLGPRFSLVEIKKEISVIWKLGYLQLVYL